MYQFALGVAGAGIQHGLCLVEQQLSDEQQKTRQARLTRGGFTVTVRARGYLQQHCAHAFMLFGCCVVAETRAVRVACTFFRALWGFCHCTCVHAVACFHAARLTQHASAMHSVGCVALQSRGAQKLHVPPSGCVHLPSGKMFVKPTLSSAKSTVLESRQPVLVLPTINNYAVIDGIIMVPAAAGNVVAYLLQPTVDKSHAKTRMFWNCWLSFPGWMWRCVALFLLYWTGSHRDGRRSQIVSLKCHRSCGRYGEAQHCVKVETAHSWNWCLQLMDFVDKRRGASAARAGAGPRRR